MVTGGTPAVPPTVKVMGPDGRKALQTTYTTGVLSMVETASCAERERLKDTAKNNGAPES